MGNSCTLNNQNKSIKDVVFEPIKYKTLEQSQMQSIRYKLTKSHTHHLEKLQLGEYFLQNGYLSKLLTQEKKAKENELFLNILYKPTKTQYYSEYFHSEFEQCLIQNISQQKLKLVLSNNPQMKYRRFIWKVLLFDPKIYELTRYDESQLTENKHSYSIQKDINRTYPNYLYFTEEPNTSGQQNLQKVLQSISILYPQIGYCQGMNFVVGLFLMIYEGNIQESFQSFAYMVKKSNFMISGFYEDGFPLLELYQQLFWKVLTKKNGEYSQHCQNWMFPESAWISKWFMTLFIYSFPMDFVVMLIDHVIIHGLFFMIKVGVQFMLQFQNQFRQFDMFAFNKFLVSLKEDPSIILDSKSEFYLDLNKFFKSAVNNIKVTRKLVNNTSSEILKSDETNSNSYLQHYSLYNFKEPNNQIQQI